MINLRVALFVVDHELLCIFTNLTHLIINIIYIRKLTIIGYRFDITRLTQFIICISLLFRFNNILANDSCIFMIKFKLDFCYSYLSKIL